ncbi:MAG: right-handed parallel beta-helix repeat-containing protein [Dehalococcoidia bacterium]|nr:right-handed parallel beta-helix repeat-containing protein [Dehalococcoidia bacterium]
MKSQSHRARSVLILALVTAAGSAPLLAGPLNPPAGPITSTYKTLTEVEPRTAVNTVNTPGDADSLFKITQPGSYYLTGNISGVSGKHGIEIAASGVTIDLNGFALIGVAGSLGGIAATASGLESVSITNGTVRAWGQSGIQMSFPSVKGTRALDLVASDNGGMGLDLGEAAEVARCVVFDCAGGGVRGSVSSSVTDCTVYNNGSTGINVSTGSAVARCAVSGNAGRGIDASSGCTVTGCSVQASTDVGINASNGTTVSNCTARFNGSHGIAVFNDCMVLANTCENNGSGSASGAGVYTLGFRNRVEGNLCVAADRGIDVDGTANVIVRNTCAANTINWEIVAGNVYGPILDRTAPGGAPVSGNSGAGTLGTTDPNANFTH